MAEDDLKYLSQSRHSKTITDLKMADNLINMDRFPDFLDMVTAFKHQLQYFDISGCLSEPVHLRNFFLRLQCMQELKYLCMTTTELPRVLLLELIDNVAKIASFQVLKMLFPRDILETSDETELEEDLTVIEPRKREFCSFIHNHVSQLCDKLGRSKFVVALR